MSTTSAVSSAGSTAANTTAPSSSIMGRDSFLLLLVTQLQNQDPMNPMDDKDFAAQLAQFSSLEQMMNMSESLDAVGRSATFGQALSLTGKWVEYSGNDGQAMVGQVQSVSYANGAAQLIVDGNVVDLSSVTRVYPGVDSLGQNKSATQAIGLIGKSVSYVDPATGRVVTGKVSGVVLSDGWPGLVVGDSVIAMSDVLDTNGSVGSSSDSDLEALAKSMVGMKVDYTSGGQTLSGRVTKAALDGETWKLTVGSSLIGLGDVVKVYPAR